MSSSIETTSNILSGSEPLPEFDQIKVLVEQLKRNLSYGLAVNLLEKVKPKQKPENDEEIWIVLQLALCICKVVDPSIQPQIRLNNALVLVESSELLKRFIELLKDMDFGLARKILEIAKPKIPDLKNLSHVWIIQQLALCTYKDEELYPQHRLDKALELLESIGLRDSTNTDAETLALGGAVYKRMWEFSGQLEELYESLAFYRAAHERNPQQDMGYGAN